MSSLQIGDVDCRYLASQYGTPLYVYNQNEIVKRAREAMDNFVSDKFKTEVIYASKAFSCGALFRMLSGEGLGFDVVSGGELYGAMRIGADMKKIYFHGNNKSDQEIEMALDVGVGYFVIDNVMECRRLVEISERKGLKTRALLRINPGISAHTHEYIMTSTPDSKFGIHIKARERIAEVMQMLLTSRFVSLAGFHSHIGSQIVDVNSFEKALGTMIDFLSDLKKEYGLDDMELSIGGGFGIKYVEDDDPVDLGEMCSRLIQCAERCLENRDVHICKLITEPGRSMVGEAGYTLYTIGDMKTSGDKNYIFVDGGMSDNIRHALYDADYTGVLAEKLDEPNETTYCIAGKNCESGDILIPEMKLPKAEPGDLLAVFSTGAYGYSMASNYNRLGRPAVVFVGNGQARLVIRRETYEDQYRLEV